MRLAVALVACLASAAASAQPSCWPDASLTAIVARDDAPVQIGQIAVRTSSVGMVLGYSCRRADGGVRPVEMSGALEVVEAEAAVGEIVFGAPELKP